MPPGLWSQVPRLSLQEVAPHPPPNAGSYSFRTALAEAR